MPRLIDRRVLLLAGAALAAPSVAGAAKAAAAANPFAGSSWRRLTDAEWRRRLSPAAFDILRREGTEPPGSSPLLQEHRRGVFACAGCGLPLFRSEWKFESGTGWPSFYTVMERHISRRPDHKLSQDRVEYRCAQCLGHQGHVFEDGPRPTGLRYCNDGLALKFTPA